MPLLLPPPPLLLLLLPLLPLLVPVLPSLMPPLPAGVEVPSAAVAAAPLAAPSTSMQAWQRRLARAPQAACAGSLGSRRYAGCSGREHSQQ